MATDGIKVNMTPSHPGDFIRTEIIEELGLNVTRAAEILGVSRATLSDLLNGNARYRRRWHCASKKHSAWAWTCCCGCSAWYDASQMRARANEITFSVMNLSDRQTLHVRSIINVNQDILSDNLVWATCIL